MRPHRDQQRVLVGNAGESEQAEAAEATAPMRLAPNYLACGIEAVTARSGVEREPPGFTWVSSLGRGSIALGVLRPGIRSQQHRDIGASSDPRLAGSP